MPTENRSSHTEMVSDLLPCPFCGEKPQITKHHRDDIYGFMHRCEVLGPISWGFREDPQAHVEKWNARVQPAQQHQGEPVAYVDSSCLRNLRVSGFDSFSALLHSKQADMLSQQRIALYTHADPAEVERLRAVIEQQKNLIQSLRAELVESYSIDASAEQSAPVEIDERAEFERSFVVQEGVFFSKERNEYRSMNGWTIEETDSIDLNLRLSGWQARAALERKPSPHIPEGYCVMPRQLTAENGAKALLLGEFKLEVTHDCPECAELEEPAEGCEICDGAGEYGQRHTIPWDKIKFIYSEAVKGLAIKQ